jgi:hypothetical protein
MSADQTLREHLTQLLTESHVHMQFADAVANFPAAHMNTPFPNGTYTPWHLLEHVRLAQEDILDFIRNPSYQEREWPKDYWPGRDSTASTEAWQRTLAAFQADLRALVAIAQDPATDLYAPIPHGSGQTILRELLVVADHNAYHLGEFAIMRQAMGTWDAGHQ